MQFAIGSTNPIKIDAAANVLKRVYPDARLMSVDTPSGVDRQPHSDKEARLGALNRARTALDSLHADYGIGLESGVIETEFGLMTCAWCTIIRSDGFTGVGGGAHILLPESVSQLIRRGYELGQAMDQVSGQHNTKLQMGALGLLTNSLIDRRSAFEAIICLALGPFVTEHYYRS